MICILYDAPQPAKSPSEYCIFFPVQIVFRTVIVFYFKFLEKAHALVTPGSGIIMGCSLLELENIVIYSITSSFIR